MIQKISAVLMAAIIMVFAIPKAKVLAGEYNIGITMQTLEIDIDEIPEDRYVSLDVFLENNPSEIEKIYFLIEKDSRLEFQSFFIGDFDLFNGQTISFLDDNKGFIGLRCSPDKKLTCTGKIFNILLKLPDNVAVGDFFSVKWKKENASDLWLGYVVKDNIFDQSLNEEYDSTFMNLTDGGIRIVDQENDNEHHEYSDKQITDTPQINDPPVQAQETPQTVYQEQSNIEPSKSETVTSPSNTKILETTGTDEIEETVTKKKLVTSARRESQNTKKIKQKTTTILKDNYISETVTSREKKQESNSSMSLVLIVGVALAVLALIGVSTYIVKKRKDK
ncbi:MAG: hypothetical protein Q4F95_10000 [Oscillospiraceae bacterium]|nr:hypothetical protein [Oscillospiraceae bacterium]